MTAWVAWMASSTEERMAAIFFCSGRGGSWMRNRENSVLLTMGTAVTPTRRCIFGVAACSAYYTNRPSTVGLGTTALICWLLTHSTRVMADFPMVPMQEYNTEPGGILVTVSAPPCGDGA